MASTSGEKWSGVDIQRETITDNMEACVWEPALVKQASLFALSFLPLTRICERS